MLLEKSGFLAFKTLDFKYSIRGPIKVTCFIGAFAIMLIRWMATIPSHARIVMIQE
jgi:hypothetical protein